MHATRLGEIPEMAPLSLHVVLKSYWKAKTAFIRSICLAQSVYSARQSLRRRRSFRSRSTWLRDFVAVGGRLRSAVEVYVFRAEGKGHAAQCALLVFSQVQSRCVLTDKCIS